MTMPTHRTAYQAETASVPPPASPGPRIFIMHSCGSGKTEAAVFLIHRALADRFGSEIIVNEGSPTPDATRPIEVQVQLAVIDPDWVGGIPKRYYDPDDRIRRAIITALDLKVPVIPVLIGDTALPTAGDLPLDLAPLTRMRLRRVRDRTEATDIAQLVEHLAKLLDPEPAAHPSGGPTVPAQVRQRLLRRLQTRYSIDEQQLEQEFPGEAAAAAAALVADGLAAWRTVSPRTLVLTPAGVEHSLRDREQFEALLSRSSVRSWAARRLRRSVRPEDTARAVALADGDGDVTAAVLTALWLLRLDDLPDRHRNSQRSQALSTLTQWSATPHSHADEALRQLVRDGLVDLMRDWVDDWEPTRFGTDECSAWRTLRNITVHDTGDAEYLLSALYRGKLRSFAAALADDDHRSGDHIADMVLRQGARQIQVVEVKDCRQPPAATAPAPSRSATCASWLIGITMKTARRTGRLRRPVAAWSDHCVAISGTDDTDPQVLDEHFRGDWSIVFDLSAMTEQPARRLIDRAATIACTQGGAVHRVDRQVFMLVPAPPSGGASTTDNEQLFVDIFRP